MPWLSVIVPALVLAAILYVPGIAVNALFLRKRLYTVGFAPVTGAAILGFASLASGVIPGHWSPLPYVGDPLADRKRRRILTS